jgi:hypothetical protein
MWIKTCVAALGIVGGLVAVTPAPTLAQGVYFGPNGVGIDIDHPRHYRDYPGDRGYAYERGYQGCRTITIQRDDGSMKQIRRCD